VAEALARGESASAEISRPTLDGELIISVRTAPLRQNGRLHGHLLMLTPLGKASSGLTQSHGLLTKSEAMRSLLRIAEKVAASDASVLVRGETGAGKELVARAIHRMSPRRDKPFAAINCAALPPQLIESELFGHVRGAFTGAVRDSEGTFRHAEGGTIFLDEVAELPLEVQAKLLRVTQERTVLPVGGTKPIPVNVRLISATHRSLRTEVKAGRFRADLMYRLRVVPLFLPSLRQRPEDIEALATHFLGRLNETSTSRQVARIAPGALDALLHHSWPGNVRELHNAVEYAFLLGDGPVLSEGDLPPELRENFTEFESRVPVPDGQLPPKAQKIARALERAGGNRSRAAASLGISRSTLWRRMKEHHLHEQDEGR
jgi:transcriptional regulator with PAS, ATPase and Fis domain